MFGDSVVATALLDRLLHHAIVIQSDGARIDSVSMLTASQAFAHSPAIAKHGSGRWISPRAVSGCKSRISQQRGVLWDEEVEVPRQPNHGSAQACGIGPGRAGYLPGLGINNWRGKYGGMDVLLMAKMKEPEAEDAGLRKMYV